VFSRFRELFVLQGEVKEGEIVEGDIGSTWDNKRFKVVEITTPDGPIRRASCNQKVTLMVKTFTDCNMSSQDTIYIE
jgi:sulfate adenylyltransferase subunit 1 (EFTu-like GTPase family)